MKYIHQLLICLLPTICYGQDTTVSEPWTDPINLWKSYDLPNPKLVHIFNSEPDDWTVFMKGNEVWVTDRFETPADILSFTVKQDLKNGFFVRNPKTIQKVEDGFLVAYNAGEWGGRIDWFSKNGKQKYTISRHQVETFLTRNHKLYAIQGLAHLSMSKGSIIEIKKVNEKWQAVEYLKLPYAPEAAAVDKHNNFIIITSNNMVKVDEKARMTVLIEDGFWAYYLYPSSAVIKENMLYIGMRKGVLKYDLKNGSKEWLLPK